MLEYVGGKPTQIFAKELKEAHLARPATRQHASSLMLLTERKSCGDVLENACYTSSAGATVEFRSMALPYTKAEQGCSNFWLCPSPKEK